MCIVQQNKTNKTEMTLAKQIQKLVDQHTDDIVKQLAAKYGFDPVEARASIVEPAVKRKAASKPRAANAFMRFSKAERPTVKQEHPDMAPKDVLRELGRRWQELSDTDKEPYQTAYEDAKAALKQSAGSDSE